MTPQNDFETITESAPLLDELRERIRAGGPITFREFMAAALYHPRYGYYSTSAGTTGRSGDYVTSPEVHSIFGALVARQIFEMWSIMSCPPAFDLIEQGAGTGRLAADILRWSKQHEPAFARAVRYTLVDTSPRLRDIQMAALADAGVKGAQIRETLPEAVDGVLLSNELVDAFPVHRVLRHGRELHEVYVDVDADGRLVDRPGPMSDHALRAYFDDLGLLPSEGCLAEVNLDAPRWIEQVARSLRRGYVMTFDYGYEAPDLYASWRRDGTLLCFHRQSASSDPYQRAGRQDMTASVDFTTLKRAGEAAGLQTLGMTDQASFLVRMGIGEGVAAASGDMEEYFARRKVVMDLIEPGRLGRIKVLLQGLGVPDVQLRGFHDA